ncbi:hypothetical protein WICPIJ_004376 [Wickerhamomyces pijperi]|uniref:TauD/TfdA-like domain-containing protein n=1 Tax=Wickerhamomyces pijperi TaxID=599730 RepID=A0A9P8Q7T4_WICPI|nr:hypothetical protein WICPIJ_004376 [Wickerhamomyces pijperi]
MTTITESVSVPTATNIVDEINKKAEALTISIDVSKRVEGGFSLDLSSKLPPLTKARFDRHGLDYSRGYPQKPATGTIPLYAQEAQTIRDYEIPYTVRGKDADPEFKALFAKTTEVKHLTKYIGTELVGVQLNDLNEKELDELALLIAQRVVVFFRDQDLSPKKQIEIAEFFGIPEIHPIAFHPTGEEYQPLRVIWSEIFKHVTKKETFKQNKVGTGVWHSDHPHEYQPAGITHLHIDSNPDVGGDTLWASGYAAFDKLSPAFQKFLEGKYAIQQSLNWYVNKDDPLGGLKPIERRQPVIRTHPVTGWKSLYVNRDFTTRIEGLEPEESKTILNYLFDVYEKSLDIQVRFNWSSGSSALWDNRVSQHVNVHDLIDENGNAGNRHGTRSVSLAEVPFFDPKSSSQREAQGLAPKRED